MSRLCAAIVLTLLGCATASGFDAETKAVIAGYKSHKPLAASDVQTLMRSSERWCYLEEAGSCAWTDIYLEVTADSARFEIGSPFTDEIDIFYSESGAFSAEGRLCETSDARLESMHAANRSDGKVITGRALQAIRDQLAADRHDDVDDCFGYLYLGTDADAQTVTLVQRQYTKNVYRPEKDVTVTLHFDPANAEALTLRW